MAGDQLRSEWCLLLIMLVRKESYRVAESIQYLCSRMATFYRLGLRHGAGLEFHHTAAASMGSVDDTWGNWYWMVTSIVSDT